MRSGWEIVFPADGVPGLDEIADRIATEGGQGTSCMLLPQREGDEPVLECLVSGLTFDLHRARSSEEVGRIHARHLFGIDPATMPEWSSLAIVPSPHIAGASASLSVVRAGAQLALSLARMEGALAVVWQPLSSVMESGYFARLIGQWLDGGVFPSLGLVAFERNPAKEWRSVGLRYFIGQELELAPAFPVDRGENFKLAARLIDRIVEYGPVSDRIELETLDGMKIELRASPDGRIIQALPLT